MEFDIVSFGLKHMGTIQSIIKTIDMIKFTVNDFKYNRPRNNSSSSRTSKRQPQRNSNQLFNYFKREPKQNFRRRTPEFNRRRNRDYRPNHQKNRFFGL